MTRMLSFLLLVTATGIRLASAGQAAPAGASPAPAPSVGDVVPAFDAQGVDGAPHRVEFKKGSQTLLLFFVPGCPACHKMIPEWNRAFERKPKGLEVIGVVMDKEPPGYFTAMPVAFPVVRSPGRPFLQSLKVQRAPLTLRVGPGGRVEDVALGVVDPIRLGELFHP